MNGAGQRCLADGVNGLHIDKPAGCCLLFLKVVSDLCWNGNWLEKGLDVTSSHDHQQLSWPSLSYVIHQNLIGLDTGTFLYHSTVSLSLTCELQTSPACFLPSLPFTTPPSSRRDSYFTTCFFLPDSCPLLHSIFRSVRFLTYQHGWEGVHWRVTGVGQDEEVTCHRGLLVRLSDGLNKSHFFYSDSWNFVGGWRGRSPLSLKHM